MIEIIIDWYFILTLKKLLLKAKLQFSSFISLYILIVSRLYGVAHVCVTALLKIGLGIDFRSLARGTLVSFSKLVGGYIEKPEFLVIDFSLSFFLLLQVKIKAKLLLFRQYFRSIEAKICLTAAFLKWSKASLPSYQAIIVNFGSLAACFISTIKLMFDIV